MNDEHTTNGKPQERVESYWLVLHYTDNPPIRFDARLLDRVFVNDRDLVLEVDETVVALRIIGEEGTAYKLAEALVPYTRSAPITRQDVYEDARQRLAGIGEKGERLAPSLFFGSDPVRVSDEIVYVGEFACTLSDTKRYASVGAALPISDGALQAGFVLLVVAARKRADDAAILFRRITEYETRLNAGISKK
jgi:hypothetical protein